jgi:hypothetical protein
MIRFWDIVERTETGPYMREHDFDLKVFMTTQRLVKEYDINYSSEKLIPTDDSLVNDAFKAAVELILDTGIFCLDTSRVVEVEKEEIKEVLREAPREIVFGSGKDEARMTSRTVEDIREPFCLLTAVGTPVSEQLFVKVMQSYAQEALADTYSTPSLLTLHGKPIRSGTPLEVDAAIWNAIWMREAARLAGRPDIGCHNVVACAEKTAAILAAMKPEFGVRNNDGLAVAALGELKIDYERMNKAAYMLRTGHIAYGLYGPLMGGYAGGPEATAIVLIAYHFLGALVYRAMWHCCFPLHIHEFCNTTPEMVWLTSLASQAISRNTNLLSVQNGFMAAGPCTEMVMYELAVYAAVATISGSHLDLAAVARNKQPDRCSGMEARVGAEVGHIVARMRLKRTDANEIIKKIVSKYEEKISEAPIGKKFSECYDIVTVTPSKEYLELYERVRKELTDLGIDFSYL